MPHSAGTPTPDRELLRRRSLGRALCCDAELPRDLVERLWDDPHSLLPLGEQLQDKPRCTVVKIDHPAGAFVLKHHNWGGPIRTAKKSLRTAPARQSWIDGHQLRDSGLLVPRPRAYAERRAGPFGICSYLLTDYVVGTSLYRFLRFEQPSADVVRDLARQVAAIWQQLDELRVSHNDLKADNFLIDPTGRVWLIDLEKMRHHRHREQVQRYHAEDVKRLFHPRNWRSDPAVAEVFRQAIVATPAMQAALAGPHGKSHPILKPLATQNGHDELVTVLVTTHNNAATIAGSLESARDIADELLVADAGSTDETLDIVRRFGGCRVIQRVDANPADFANWARSQARHHWVLAMQGNERISPDLARDIQYAVASRPAEDGFRVTRRYYYWGQLAKLGGLRNDSSVRLFRRDAGYFVTREGRAKALVDSDNVGSLQSKMLFEPCTNAAQGLSDLERDARLAAQQAHRQGRRASIGNVLLRAPWRFFRSYVLQLGCLDGWTGLHASCQAATAVYLREMMLWEMNQESAKPQPISGSTLTIDHGDSLPMREAA